jgi:DNA polymerase I-like protein with 3'-5' exonuclease and polymerase domains
MSNFIYDEIIVECKDELSDQYRIILEDCMKNAANYYVNYDKEIVMSCTANVGDSWYSVK